MKIVVSAVNLTEGGPLTILNSCLSTLSESLDYRKFEVVAIVNDKKRCFYDNINYIELQWPKKMWLNRLFYEFIYLNVLSKRLNPDLFFSLHDISPSVNARLRAVYCHNSTPFYHPALTDIRFNYKEFLFSLFYRYLYKINIHKNNFVIVQQKWMKNAFVDLYKLEKEKVIVSKPFEDAQNKVLIDRRSDNQFLFFFPAFPRTFKNFEVICDACRILEKEGFVRFKVVLTLDGTENSYANHICQEYSFLKTVCFCGLLSKEQVHLLYEETNCLIFPSKLETWGLPISEFTVYKRPMLIADLPYAYETALGAEKVSFFNPDNPIELAQRMKEIVEGQFSAFKAVPTQKDDEQTVYSWNKLFDKILNEKA